MITTLPWGVTIAQIRVPDTTNEITQVATLLAGIRPRKASTLFSPLTQRTRNATQPNISATVGCDYVMTVII
ncbi:MAG: hypothetical protein ACRDSL_10060 [Pseudonocardiaceae bacterium]